MVNNIPTDKHKPASLFSPGLRLSILNLLLGFSFIDFSRVRNEIEILVDLQKNHIKYIK
ncbi:hypothetical protein AM1BK_39270 [Neobacillus kokaensis]|uniref:Uncharacterized protein n=1 Tax=Neobacillus kokaensis TaxID=2759023 RepID=A0ABQ3N863_9BACI|nr:hypothetical protein AM1BK_39270 [Neobacillus kokaensis]